MADKIINTDTMIGKVISIMIALLFVVILAFPVANSLSNQGSGGGESESITYTNTGEFYYKSATADNEEHTILVDCTLDFPNNETSINTTIITVDGVEVYSNTEDSDILRYGIPYVLFGWNEQGPIELDMYSTTVFYWISAENRVWMDGTPGSYEEGDTFERYTISFSVSEGNIIGVDSRGEPVSVPIDYFISSDGTYVLADSPVVSVIENMDIGVMLARRPTSITHDYWTTLYILGGWIESESITADVQNITSLEIYTTAEQTRIMDYSVILNSMSNGNIRSIESIDAEVYLKDVLPDEEIETEDMFTNTQFLVPTTVIVPAEGGDSDSGSGIGGIASTLVKLVPILLIVGILLVLIIPMIQNRMQ